MENVKTLTACVSEKQTQVRRASLKRRTLGFLLLFIANGKLQRYFVKEFSLYICNYKVCNCQHMKICLPFICRKSNLEAV